MNQKGSMQIAVIVVLLVLVAGGGSYYLLKKGDVASRNVTPTQTQVASQISSETETPNATENSDWKVYNNSEFGFELRYPSDVQIGETSRKIVFYSLEQRGLIELDYEYLDQSMKSLTLQQIVDKVIHDVDLKAPFIMDGDAFEVVTSKQNSTFWGQDSVEVVSTIGGSYEGKRGQVTRKTIILKKGDRLFRIKYSTGIVDSQKNNFLPRENVSVAESIIATFRFTGN